MTLKELGILPSRKTICYCGDKCICVPFNQAIDESGQKNIEDFLTLDRESVIRQITKAVTIVKVNNNYTTEGIQLLVNPAIESVADSLISVLPALLKPKDKAKG